jgi:hypothetical protein
MPYNTAAIRNLLKTIFSDEELQTFCFDHFPLVYDEFAASMSRSQKIQSLVKQCARSGQFGKLLDDLEEEIERRGLSWEKRSRLARQIGELRCEIQEQEMKTRQREEESEATKKFEELTELIDNRALRIIAGGLKSLVLHQKELNRWKELHHSLQEIIIIFQPFVGEVDHFYATNGTINRRRLRQLWNEVKLRVNRLTSSGRERWISEISARAEQLDASIEEADRELLYDLTKEFSSICNFYLSLSDDKLKTEAEASCILSVELLGRID